MPMNLRGHLRLAGIIILLFTCACSDNSGPFTPSNIALGDLAFFPLREGYMADYRYYRKIRFGDPDRQESSELLALCCLPGLFHLEVIDTFTKEKAVFYRIKTSLQLYVDYCSGPYDDPLDNSSWKSGLDSLSTVEYDLLYRNNTLWYVRNAPSFERLDEGDTTLMMAAPVGRGGYMNLKMFPVGAFWGAPMEMQPSYVMYGDTLCFYQQNDPRHCSMVKGRGVKSLQCSQGYWGQQGYYEMTERIELID